MGNCIIYTRVSTSSQADKEFNSCEAQRDRILSYIDSQESMSLHGEISDPGFSGSTIKRPGLTQLLDEIKNPEIKYILTYKIDRLTRSSKDFYWLIEYLEKYGVSFISVTERFDTSSPSGRLLRNIMLTFAQFEREMTAERTKHTMLQRAKKGIWNGGRVSLGYKVADKKLVIDKLRAKIIQAIFDKFIETESLKSTLEFVREQNIVNPKTNKVLTLNGVFHILRNPIYIGKMVWDDEVYDSNHKPILSEATFYEAKSVAKDQTKIQTL
ncbi:MAG: site-specific DNA recombinase [Candidatus Omnitrophota bacterium]|jgi:site-specific DNA recombinase